MCRGSQRRSRRSPHHLQEVGLTSSGAEAFIRTFTAAMTSATASGDRRDMTEKIQGDITTITALGKVARQGCDRPRDLHRSDGRARSRPPARDWGWPTPRSTASASRSTRPGRSCSNFAGMSDEEFKEFKEGARRLPPGRGRPVRDVQRRLRHDPEGASAATQPRGAHRPAGAGATSARSSPTSRSPTRRRRRSPSCRRISGTPGPRAARRRRTRSSGTP